MKKAWLTLSFAAFMTLLPGLLALAWLQERWAPQPAEEAAASVYQIRTYDKKGKVIRRGSGFLIFSQGVVATNFHVLEGGCRFTVEGEEGVEIPAEEILLFHKEEDLALLKIPLEEEPLKGVPWGLFLPWSRGASISSPGERFNEISHGIITGISDGFIEFSGKISYGSSGGALLSPQGQVLGVITAMTQEKPETALAIPYPRLLALYRAYEKGEYTLLQGTEEEGQAFLPDLFDEEGGSEAEAAFPSGARAFRPASLEAFYQITGGEEILRRALEKHPTDPFLRTWRSFTPKEKAEVAEYYSYLRFYDPWWCSRENPGLEKDKVRRKDDPEEWEREQYLLDLGILRRHEIPIFWMMTREMRYKEEFTAAVRGLPLESWKGTVLLLLQRGYATGDFSPGELEAARQGIRSLGHPRAEEVLSSLEL